VVDSGAVPYDPPSLADLRRTAAAFSGFADADTTWLRLAETAKPAVDLSRADHRVLLLRWLNSWGCRIRYRATASLPRSIPVSRPGGRRGNRP
jgi:hypothetical protein